MDEQRDDFGGCGDLYSEKACGINILRAERDRYREALMVIKSYGHDLRQGKLDPYGIALNAIEEAETALKESDDADV